jgi:hypothetical protein
MNNTTEPHNADFDGDEMNSSEYIRLQAEVCFYFGSLA